MKLLLISNLNIADNMNAINTEKKLADLMGISYNIEQVQIGNHRINYLTAGSGEPLILIHGGNIGWGQWYPNIAALSKHFKVYAIDLPGAGRSSLIDFDSLDPVTDFLDVVVGFIKARGLFSVNLLGSSIGGWVCLMTALREPRLVSKIILADSLGFTTKAKLFDRFIGIRSIAKFLSRTLLRPVRNNKNVERFMRGVFSDKHYPISADFIEYFYETMSKSHNLLLISKLAGPSGVRKEFILLDQLPNIKNDTLIIWGREDKLMPIDEYRKKFDLLPSAKLEVIDKAGHIPSIEASEKFNNLVIKFLRS